MSSAVEIEVGALFHKVKVGERIKIALEEMVYPQPVTPMHKYKYTADGIVKNKVHQKCTKAMDM